MNGIPKLDGRCNSWVVSRRDNGEVIGEFYLKSLVEMFNQEKCLIETASQYLSRINKKHSK